MPARLAGSRGILMFRFLKAKYICPCCGRRTLPARGRFDICPVCYWEDDPLATDNPDNRGNANRISLTMARQNFADFGACTQDMLPYVRKPSAKH
ncbi:MAG: CPCC family cysteine-rich protein [Eubacteriales bacterium]